MNYKYFYLNDINKWPTLYIYKLINFKSRNQDGAMKQLFKLMRWIIHI